MIHTVNALLSSVYLGIDSPIQSRRLVDLILRFGSVITRIAIAIELESKHRQRSLSTVDSSTFFLATLLS